MGFPYLPEELWRSEILLRLPVKSVLSCKYVCKSLYSLIKTHDFQQLHLRVFNNNSSDHNNLFLPCDSTNPKGINEDNNFHGKFRPYYYGYVDGILLTQRRRRNSDERKDDVISLWNPCIDKGLDIPIPNEILKVFGFGLDTVTTSYKVVAFYVEQQQQQLSSPPNYHLNYNVYNVSDGTWSSDRRAKLDIYVAKPRYLWMTYFESGVYWICERDINVKYSHYSCLLCFNLIDEQFTYLRLPANDDGTSITKLRTSSSVESGRTRLSVSNQKLIFLRLCSLKHLCIGIWAREKESWVKLYELDLGLEDWRLLTSNVGRVFGNSSSDDSTRVHFHLKKILCVFIKKPWCCMNNSGATPMMINYFIRWTAVVDLLVAFFGSTDVVDLLVAFFGSTDVVDQ